MDIQGRLTAFSMLGAEWVMWLLILLSVISLAIILERAYFFITSRDNIVLLHEKLIARLRGNDYEGARKLLGASQSHEARIANAGLDAVDGGPSSVEERLAGESQLARLQMERNLAFLGTVGNNAPFVGLLGTVIGVIQAFHELGRGEGRLTGELMETIGEALVATAIGILVALPAVAFFNFYSRVIKSRLMRAEALGRDVMAHLKTSRTNSLEAAE